MSVERMLEMRIYPLWLCLDISHTKVSNIIFTIRGFPFLRATSLYSDASSPGLKNNVFFILFPISPLLIQKIIKIIGCAWDFNKIVINVIAIRHQLGKNIRKEKPPSQSHFNWKRQRHFTLLRYDKVSFINFHNRTIQLIN